MAIKESIQYYIEKQFTLSDRNAKDYFVVGTKADKRHKLALMDDKLASVQERLKNSVDPNCIKRCNDIIKNLNTSIASLRKNLNER